MIDILIRMENLLQTEANKQNNRYDLKFTKQNNFSYMLLFV